MARSGRFGSLPGKAPDLSSTIVALLEQYEGARDRNILNAWLNGGQFEGKKVTDGRIKQWFKSRRSEYDKDDPEYDYWDQQLKQVDYQIGESKMLLAFEQGKIKEGGAAAWYTKNANRFPKNSEAWREAMRNAARFKKSAQESSRAGRTISKSERYDNEIQRIYKNKIAPGEAAIAAWEEMLKNAGYEGNGGFLGLNAEDMAGDEDMRRFLNTKEGRKVRQKWEQATGTKWSFKAMRRLVSQAEEGYGQAAQVATRYGFDSYASSFKNSQRGIGQYDTQFKAYNGDIYDRYLSLSDKYKEQLANADSPKERNAIRKWYATKLDRLAGRANRIGDNELTGALRRESLAVQGKDFRSNVSGTLDEAGRGATARPQGKMDDLKYQEVEVAPGQKLTTGQLDTTGMSSLEIERAQAERDSLAEDGLKDGSWMWMKDGEGKVVALPTANLEEFYGNSDFVAAGAKINYRYNADGTREAVLIQPEPLYVDWGNGPEIVQGYTTYENLSGETRYVIDGNEDTSTLPWEGLDEYDDGNPATPTGTIGYLDSNGVLVYDPVYETVGNTVRFDPKFADIVQGQYLTDAYGATYNEATGTWEVTDESGNTKPINWTADMRKESLNWGVRNANIIWGDDDTTPERSFGFEALEVQVPNPDYVAPLRERMGSQTVEELRESMTDQQWEQFKAEVDRTVPGSSISQKLLDFNRDSSGVREQVITNLYENPDVATFGGSEDTEVQAAAVEARQGASEEDIDWLMMNNVSTGDRVMTLRQEIEDWGPGTDVGDRAQAELDSIRERAVGIAESNLESGVTARGEAIERTEDDDFGYAGDVVDPGEVAAATQFSTGSDGESGAPTLTETVEVPRVLALNDTGTTSDRSGILAQYQSPLGREQLAKMPAEQRNELLADVVERNGQTGNPDFTFAIAQEIDALTSTGDHAGDEEYYIRQSGSLSDDQRFRGIYEARRVANASDGVSLAEPLKESLYSDLKASGWSEEQIKERFPDAAEEQKLRNEDAYSILPGPYDQGGANYRSSSAVLSIDGAVRNAQQAYTDSQGIRYPQGTTPFTPQTPQAKMDYKPVTTFKPDSVIGNPGLWSQPTQAQAPAAPAAAAAPPPPPSFNPRDYGYNVNPNAGLAGNRSTGPGAYRPPTPYSTPKPPSYQQPTFKPPGIK